MKLPDETKRGGEALRVRRWEARDESFREGTMSVNDHAAQRRLLIRSEKGCQTLVEYGLILVLIAAVTLVAVGAVGLAVFGQLDSITAAITHVE